MMKPPRLIMEEVADKCRSTRARLAPPLIFSPLSPADVAQGLKILEIFKTPFALRSGGHAPDPSWSSTEKGVLIRLSEINDIVVNVENSTVTVGAGCRRGEVYAAVGACDSVVAGGRYADVACGGHLTGCESMSFESISDLTCLQKSGGSSSLLGLLGFSSDNVVDFEVVVSGGQILHASQADNPDLYWALKGGSNNFGIVTHFTLTMFGSAKFVQTGALIYSSDKTPDILGALVDFQDKDFEQNLDSGIGPTIIKIPEKQVDIIAVGVYTQPSQEDPRSF
jgi:FAD/FMN-containing dehydrogenase